MASTKKRKPKQATAGAPTICTPELTRQFAELMAAGNYFETVAGYLRIDKQTAYNWMEWGEAGRDATGPNKDAYRTFFDSVTHATEQAEIRGAALLQRAGQDRTADLPMTADGEPDKSKVFVQGDWRAIAEFMARRYPKRWSKAERVSQEHTGPNGGPVQVETSTKDMSDEQVAALAANIGAALSSGGGSAPSDAEGED